MNWQNVQRSFGQIGSSPIENETKSSDRSVVLNGTNTIENTRFHIYSSMRFF